MIRLRDRNRQIPGGMKFWVAQTKWAPVPWSSFESIVAQLIEHRKGNKFLTSSNGWSLDPSTVAAEVDLYNATLAQQMGWNDFIYTGEGGQAVAATPFQPRPRHRLKNVVVDGSSTLVEWIKDGAEAVPADQSTHRAGVCVVCPRNSKGDWTRFFTVPVSEAIRHELERRKGMNLSTPYDDQLQVCEACSCPLKLKVHVDIDSIMGSISAEAMADLHPLCWVLAESSK